MKEFYQKGNSSNAQRMVSDEESKMPGKGKRPRRCDHRRGRPEMFSTEIPRSLCIASRVGDIGTALLSYLYLPIWPIVSPASSTFAAQTEEGPSAS